MAKKKKKQQKEKKKKGFSPTYWIMVGVVFAIIASPSSFILIALGMMPTFIQMLTIRNKGQLQKATILSMNAAGVLPFWVNMLQQEDSLGRAMSMAKDPYVLATMWGAAGFGMFMMWGGGKMAEAVIDVFAKNRIEKLRGLQSKMIDEFGEELERDAMRFLTGQLGPPGESDDGVDAVAQQD